MGTSFGASMPSLTLPRSMATTVSVMLSLMTIFSPSLRERTSMGTPLHPEVVAIDNDADLPALLDGAATAWAMAWPISAAHPRMRRASRPIAGWRRRAQQVHRHVVLSLFVAFAVILALRRVEEERGAEGPFAADERLHAWSPFVGSGAVGFSPPV